MGADTVAANDEGGDVKALAPLDHTAEIAELRRRLDRLERTVHAIKRVQARNLPLFQEALERITTMRETIHTHSNALGRLEKLATDNADAQAAFAESMGELVSLLKVGKGGAALARKYGVRVVTFVLGYLVLSGKMSHETQELFSHLFGL